MQEPAGLDPGRAYRLHDQVALRPEPFGALAYHYGNRRLTFLRAPELVDLLHDLANHATVADALAASGFAERRWPSVLTALAALERSDVIRAC